MPDAASPIFEGADWQFADLDRLYAAISEIAEGELGLDIFPNQIEVISAEQMLDAYSSTGMPLMYRHWSFGKAFIQNERMYRKGARGLAYEIVINSNPCVSYCLEENTAALQALVMAHAAFGHNHFFKNNHLFRQWTDPEGILGYLDHARDYIAGCEERHGLREVERLLDAGHALMSGGVFRHRRPPEPTLRQQQERARERLAARERAADYLFDTVAGPAPTPPLDEAAAPSGAVRVPEENLLFFLEKYSPVLADWQREVLRILRNVAQYFYPQKQTQIMNEGCACFTHYYTMNRLHAQGLIDDGAMLEILHNHTNVLTQPDFDDPRFGGINPYTLGFAMMQDIRRVAEDPTGEDRAWFPAFAGSGDWRCVLKDAWANYRDESFIQQFLSPKVIRDLHLFALADEAEEPYLTVTGIHDEAGYLTLRDALARSRDISIVEPDIQVVGADLAGDRTLHLRHTRRDGVSLAAADREATLAHMRRLWGYEVVLEEAD